MACYNLEVHFSWTDCAIILGNRHCEYNLTCSLRKSVRGNDKYNCWGRNPNLPAILLIIAILEEIEGMFGAPDFDVDDER